MVALWFIEFVSLSFSGNGSHFTKAVKVIYSSVYAQYCGTKKPLDELAFYFNIGAQMRE